jgi:hypothetical protein
MPLPAMLTYNELDGSEVKHILENRFEQMLHNVPSFQKHITLPRVRMTLAVKLEIWADQPAPETLNLSDRLTVVFEEPVLVDVIDAESVDCTAPTPDGHPPDQVREMHGLPIAQPSRSGREFGGQVQISDSFLDGNEVEGMPGLRVSRTGSGQIDGMPTSTNATIAKIDQGPAGLRRGEMNRNQWHFGGGKK